MKEISGKIIKPPRDTIYKDVVVIGNGPSGISLSYMLSGNWPYWDAKKINNHPDEILRARLNYSNQSNSLVMQDLMSLADGLEGRSTNPVSLLLDSLQNPCADLGMELPSMLMYKYHPEKKIDHVVLGKDLPGGSWHRMDPNLRTLSLSAWMSLPGLDFPTWELSHPINRPIEILATAAAAIDAADDDHTKLLKNDQKNKVPKSKNQRLLLECRKCNEKSIGKLNSKCQCQQKQQKNHQTTINNDDDDDDDDDSDDSNINLSPNKIKATLPKRNLTLQRQVSKDVQTRALVSRVAQYYESYVHEMGLAGNFVNDTLVKSIQPLYTGEENEESHGEKLEKNGKKPRWIVQGIRSNGKLFTYICHNVVLACGASDLPNRLGLRGENYGLPWIKHELPELELSLEKLTPQERSKMKPVLIVGAGLSAADAVTICRESKIPVIHVYRNRSAGLDKMLPENVYPEYHAVHKMMKESSIPYDFYTPLSEHTILEVSKSNPNGNHHQITVQHLKTGETRVLDISFCAILIGSRPDLRFLSNIGTKLHLQKSSNNQEQIAIRTTTTMQHQPNAQTILTNNNNNLQNKHQNKNNNINNIINNNNNSTNLKLIEQVAAYDEQWSLLTKKMIWLKNLCGKCKHFNFCDWNRRNDYKKINVRNGGVGGGSCECPRLICPSTISTPLSLQQSPTEISSLPPPAQTPTPQSPSNESPLSLSIIANDSSDEHLLTLGLGEDPFKPIDCKSNPIGVNKYTNEVLKAPKGLYSMGPLVGDNFVRFISGGALAITSSLHREND